MRKFVCIADVHIKIHKHAPINWSFNRYRLFFKHVVDVCLKENATLLIAGDLSDSAKPSLSELKLILEFFHLLADNKITTILIAGNHSYLSNNKTLYDFLHTEKFGARAGFSYIHYGDWSGGWCFEKDNKPECSLFPVSHFQLNDYDFTKGLKATKPSILLSHIRANVPPFISEEAPISEIAKNFDVCILGDIHEPLEFDNVYYTNNPLNCCYETTPDCGYIILEVDKGKCKVVRVNTDFPNLIKVITTAEDFDDTVLSLNPAHFYKIETAGVAAELKGIPKSGVNFIVEKQIIEEIEVEEGFHIEESEVQHETLEEELIWYMQQIEIPEPEIQGMMDEFIQTQSNK